MKKIFKWIGIVLGAIVLVLFIAGLYFNYKGNTRIDQKFVIDPLVVAIRSDSTSIQTGAHWADALCTNCHGDNLGGKLFGDYPGYGTFYARNLTSGKGGIGAYYKDADWVRSIRHGVTPEGRGLIGMPSADFNFLSAADLGCIIAYIKSIPPVDNELPGTKLKIIGKTLLVSGSMDGIIAAEVIDHNAPFPSAPSRELGSQFGGYLVSAFGCRLCHGKNLSGNLPPMPGAPYAPDLTSGGHLANWTAENFRNTLRTGVTPENKKLDEKFMAWGVIAKLSDDELNSIFEYLRSLPGEVAKVKE